MQEYVREFRAMNTQVQVIVVGPASEKQVVEAALRRVEGLFADVEASLSRFRPESELSRLNRAGGNPFPASRLLFTALATAVAAAERTGGIFDPTVLRVLEAAGYDRSFELISASADSGPLVLPSRTCSWRDIDLDERTQRVTLPAGCGVDLGGIGKGWTVDMAAGLLRPFGDFAVDAGGDLYASGFQVDGNAWSVGVENPLAPERDLAVLVVSERAVATSTVAHRRWQRDGKTLHHLIDPRTGRSAEGAVLAATVVAETTAIAEVLAKTALILGPEAGLALLAKTPGAEGILALADGSVLRTANTPEVLYAA